MAHWIAWPCLCCLLRHLRQPCPECGAGFRRVLWPIELGLLCRQRRPCLCRLCPWLLCLAPTWRPFLFRLALWPDVPFPACLSRPWPFPFLWRPVPAAALFAPSAWLHRLLYALRPACGPVVRVRGPVVRPARGLCFWLAVQPAGGPLQPPFVSSFARPAQCRPGPWLPVPLRAARAWAWEVRLARGVVVWARPSGAGRVTRLRWEEMALRPPHAAQPA